MAKNIIHGRTGRIIKSRKGLGNLVADYYEGIKRKEEKLNNPTKPVPGIKSVIMDAYKKGGKKAAYKAADMANNRIGAKSYTEVTVDKWIEEYEQVR